MVSQFRPLDISRAHGKARALLAAAETRLGRIPNVLGALAHSPAALQGYLGLSEALASGSIAPGLREQIALTVAEVQGCEYCCAAHRALGRLAGLTRDQLEDARRGSSPDRATDAALAFARRIVALRGPLDEAELEPLRRAGLGSGEIVEIVANVALSVFANTFSHIAHPEIDFPTAGSVADNN